MQVLWEAKDIATCLAMVVTSKGAHPGGERWLIGYTPGVKGNDYALVSLSDGLIGTRKSAADMAAQLNCGNMWPEAWLAQPRGGV